MPLDPDKLRHDIEARRAERGQGSGGRLRSGAMATVRQHLAVIEGLRDEGASWVDIAAALAAQGIVKGDGGPLNGRHLTALLASIRRQDAGRAAVQARRAIRTDLRPAPEVTSASGAPPRKAPTGGADVVPPSPKPVQDSPGALFHRLDRKAREAAEAKAERPDFSKGLIK